MNNKKMLNIFEKYESVFGVWLYSAWDFDSVDWEGLAKEAERCIELNKPMTDETKQKYFKGMEEDKIY